MEKRDQDIAALNAKLEQDKTKLNEDSQAALDDLRRTMLLVGLGTFTALLFGGYLLVWLGLVPLKRLSDAVSRVSARDFRLAVNDAKMPYELKPIVERLKQTLELLKRAFAREKQAAADISHELRTPRGPDDDSRKSACAAAAPRNIAKCSKIAAKAATR